MGAVREVEDDSSERILKRLLDNPEPAPPVSGRRFFRENTETHEVTCKNCGETFEVEDDSSERILKLSRWLPGALRAPEVEDDSSERILKRNEPLMAWPGVAEVEDDSSERILKLER